MPAARDLTSSLFDLVRRSSAGVYTSDEDDWDVSGLTHPASAWRL